MTACGTCIKDKLTVKSWWGKPEGRRPLGRPKRRLVYNIRKDLQDVGYGYMDWIGLAQNRNRWLNACECGNEFSGSVKCGEFLD